MSSRRIAVLGAGPIGLEAALAFLERGDDVHVYEREAVGGNLTRFGHVRLFSPWEMNHSKRGADLLASRGLALPGEGEYLTAREHVERYLEPLARSAPLSGRVYEGREVLHIGRDRIGKNQLIGGPRDRYPFRVLLQSAEGAEEYVSADVVVDCTGTYGNPNWLGGGNVPALGERKLAAKISYQLQDVAGRARERYAGKNVLVAGGGHSAATALEALLTLEGTTVDWAVRQSAPVPVIEDDPLPERKRLSELLRQLASGSDPRVRFRPEAVVDALREKGGKLEVELRSPQGRTVVEVDAVLAHVGFHPDNRIYRELQVHECYASSAPMKLAAALLGEASSDCLAQTSKGVETLLNPEPGFFILGAKSYGRNPSFLIRIGLQQVDELVAWLDARVRDGSLS